MRFAACLLAATVAMISSKAWSQAAPLQTTVATPAPGAAKKDDPDILWRLIHDACAKAAADGRRPPSPCTEVYAPNGPDSAYAVFKDRDGRSQYLVLPMVRISGIESPRLLAADAPNYFADAWTARLYVEAARHRHLPRDMLAMVVNSAMHRTQNQLHIHVDCVQAPVHDALARWMPVITTRWKPLPGPLPPNRHRYVARWLPGTELTANPFRLLAASLPRGDRMGLHSLVVVGARDAHGRPGFVLLSGRYDPADPGTGSGDELEDYGCAIADRLGR